MSRVPTIANNDEPAPRASRAPTPARAAARHAPTEEPPLALRDLPEHAFQRLKTFIEGAPVDAPPALAPPPAHVQALLGKGELATALYASRRAFVSAGVFSIVINILMLTGPLFMLQVYDRVMTSGSMPTLLALTLLTAVLFGFIGFLEMVRSRLVVRIGVEVEGRIGDRVFEAAMRRSISHRGASTHALRELDTLRQFVAGPGPLTLFDAPWAFAYLLVILLVHWALGIAATAGAVVLLLLAWASEARTRTPLTEATLSAARSLDLAETGQRNAEAITAMGMVGAYRNRWRELSGRSLAWSMLAADRLGGLQAISRTSRLLLQSLMLALGAALALKGEISAGSIIAATIIFGRALAPVEQLISQWRSFLKAADSYKKLDALLTAEPPMPARLALPRPAGHLDVSGLKVVVPATRELVLGGISFGLKPGQMMAVIGPSASGKSTLARALVGLWEPAAGSIRIDGARLDQWNAEDLGRYIGYLPQDVEMFAGSVRDNIARFRTDARDEDVVVAAKSAHAHELILGLPQGYDTELGSFGVHLSGGQRQRIALARALFGDPPLVVLDEPNSNLDRGGDEALAAACDGMRARGQAVVLVSHRVQAIHKADLLLYIDRGMQRAFGPRAEVMNLFQAANAPPSRRTDDHFAFPPSLKSVSEPKRAPAARKAG